MGRVTVIGLGRFGSSLAKTLHTLGYEVTAIDISNARSQEASEWVTLAAQGDGTDQDLLLQLNVNRSQVAVVAQGENLESSVLTTLILKKIGVPWVVAKATTEIHGELLGRVGADRVVFPEVDAGERLAHSINLRHMQDYLPLAATAGIARISAPPNLVGHSIADSIGDDDDRLTLLLIKRGTQLITAPPSQEVIQAQDVLVVVGSDDAIEDFCERNPPGRPGPNGINPRGQA